MRRSISRRCVSRIAERRAVFAAGPDALLPDHVQLRAFGETWPVEYRATAAAGVRAHTDGAVLAVVGNVVAQGNGDSIGCRIIVNGEVKDERTVNKVDAYTFCLDKSG